ncbi:MAG: EAL domain-containing protein [Rhodocyclaceae bacterium]|nr:EAL domain-containing protein [Rhodocyclaceae bacterium]
MHRLFERLMLGAGRGTRWFLPLLVSGVCLLVAVTVGLAVAEPRAGSGALWLLVPVLIAVAVLIAVPSFAGLWGAVRAHELAMVGAHDGLFEWNPVTKRLKVAPRLLNILGYTDDFLPDTHAWLGIVHPDDRAGYNRAVAAHLKGLTGHFYCEYRVRASNGEYRWLAARGIAVRNRKGRATLMVGSVTDITERIAREQRIREMALTDQLTGLPNRRSLLDRIPAVLAEAQRAGSMVAILFIDLDRFKNVNDSRGHAIGDDLLVALANRLAGVLRPYDSLVRQGGDELIALLPGLGDAPEAEAVARRLIEAVAEPVHLEDAEIRLTASIGVALFPRDGDDADALLRAADMAMYAAKAEGGNDLRFFEPRMMERVTARASMEQRLRIAIENGDLTLHYQPQIRFADDALIGAEALVRWRDGERMVPPDEFIGLAEETGLIDPLGRWVMESAVAQVRRWGVRYPAPLRVSINLSPRQFLKRPIDVDLLSVLLRAEVPAQRIELEITESVFLTPGNRAVKILNSLREAGCRIALDDFGTGYSSLSYLQLLQLDCLKIDKSFIHNLELAPGGAGVRNGAAIVSAMIALGHRLGYEVVAEGVETADQHLWLKALGCNTYQGYYFSRPLAVEDFERILQRQPAPMPG